MTVTGIRTIGGIVELSCDGRVSCRIAKKHFAKLPLAVGDGIDEAEYIDRIAALQAADCYEAALNLLDISTKTKNALCEKLRRKGYVAPAAEAAVQRLEEAKLLNDRLFAERIVERQKTKPIGIYAMKQKLRAKGFSEEDAEHAVQQLDEEHQLEQAKLLAQKLAPRYEKEPNERKRRALLSQALARRGFSWDVISQALEEE